MYLSKGIIISLMVLMISCQSTKTEEEIAEELLSGVPKDPSLNRPQVRKIWVPDKIDGERYEKGHYVYIIDRNSTWRLDDGDGENGSKKSDGTSKEEKGSSRGPNHPKEGSTLESE